MHRQYTFWSIVIGLLLQVNATGQTRSSLDFNSGWKFHLGNDSTAAAAKYDDSKWRSLDLPHDWSIESDFIKDAPATNQGGSLPGGIGWYRKTFKVPASAKSKKITIEFDGVYKNSEVWINGNYLGKRPYGYISFSYELTPYLLFDKANVIAIKVDNSQQPDSRWYSGSGIYRDVKLVITNQLVYVREWQAFVTTSGISKHEATVNVVTQLGSKIQGWKSFNLFFDIYDNNGKLVSGGEKASQSSLRFSGSEVRHSFSTTIVNPKLWSVYSPYLYKLIVRVTSQGETIDRYETTFGIRSFNFDAEKGFFLNNQPLKIKGVCLHHDLGALGAAFNTIAARRQLKILKNMGCNAIRFSHNPPASAMLDLCDEMGFLVIDEAYDIWKKKKNKFDYHLYFDEWGEKDLQAMVLRDRNHPSVILWSIGNEQREQFDSTGTVIVKKLVDIIKALDNTRPVITALTETLPEKNFITKANALDVLGFNYKLYDYAVLPQRFPNQKFVATETASALETRGVYNFPSDSIRIWPPDYKAQDTFSNGNKDYTSAAFDNTHAYWGATHEKAWLAVKNNSHIAGGFVWSGFDYLGEPLPYPKFPARSSYYGIIDLAGFPKDVYYLYQSEWTTKPVLHIFPHWNWELGQQVDIWAYYNNADEVELFLNGKSLGIKRKANSELHVMWRVSFEAGVVRAVSRKNGKIVLVREIRTAGMPAKIELSADRTVLAANGKDLSFVTARILDKDGNLVPDADNLIEFSVEGQGTIAGTDNGYQADTVSFVSAKRKAWKGMALAIIKSSSKQGNITLKATAQGLQSFSIALKTSN